MNTCMCYRSAVNSGHSGLDLVFFGHPLMVSFSVMLKTKEYCEIDKTYFNRIVKLLIFHPILLAIFDNTQIRIQQKNQRDGKSSMFLKMMVR
jgi:hypothetical protein